MVNDAHLTYYQRNKELILTKVKEYYKNNKDRLTKQAKEKYHSLPEEKKKEKLD